MKEEPLFARQSFAHQSTSVHFPAHALYALTSLIVFCQTDSKHMRERKDEQIKAAKG